MRAQFGTMCNKLADPEIKAAIDANGGKVVNQKVHLGFNHGDHDDSGTDIMVRVNYLGREYEKYAAACLAYKGEAKAEQRSIYVTVELEAPQSAIDAFKPTVEGLLEDVLGQAEKGLPEGMVPKASIEYPAGKILYQILVPADVGPTKKIPPMPTDIVGALADTDQYLEVHLRLAAGIDEVLNGSTLHDSINKGFCFDANFQYLRCLKKILK